MEKVVKTFRSVAQVPSVTAAQILSHGAFKSAESQLTISSRWSQTCLERGKKSSYQLIHVVDVSSRESSSLLPHDISSELISSLSPSESLRAVVREITGDDSSKKQQHLEIWKRTHLHSILDLNALEVHGDVYADTEFSCFEWSPCEKKILFIAEKKVPKSEPFYKQKAQDGQNNVASSGDKKVTKGEEYVYKQDWGESLVGKHHPAVTVYDLQSGKITVPEGVPENFSAGQARWAPDGGIVGVVWEHEPRRLGLIACNNRTSYIFHLTTDGAFKLISGKGLAVRSPRFSPDGKYLLWLERQEGGPHSSALRLVKYEWSSGKIDTVVDIVNDKMDGVDPLKFRGLFSDSMPRRCWANDNTRLVMNTLGPTTVSAVLINIGNGQLTVLNSDVNHSLSVVDVFNDYVLCSKSDLNHPPTLVLGKLPPMGSEQVGFDWIDVTEWKVFPGLENLQYGVHYTTAAHHTEGFKDINAIYVKSSATSDTTVPVILWPHGGPHGNYVNAFNITAAFFHMLGFGIIMVNYRGSTGMGQDCINFLLGKIGDADVKDCQQIAEEICDKKISNFDPSRKVLFGGSHGGFLVGHLSGQYPDAYRAVVSLNPVTDVLSMSGLTDIPDWCAVESGTAFDFAVDIKKEDYLKMYEASPIRHAQRVVAPTLMLLGKKDLRVPCSQGLMFFNKLRAHNVKTKCLMYDDGHQLRSVPIEMDFLINSALWFNEHLGIATE